MRARGDEIHVRLNGKTRGGKDAVAAKGVLARKSRGFDQSQPFFNAAGFCAVAIVIENSFAPGKTEHWIFAARQNCSVFHRNTALIEIAIERPSLKLAAREFALMHQQMKRMPVVVALFADGVEAGDELRFGEKRLFSQVGCRRGHRLEV